MSYGKSTTWQDKSWREKPYEQSSDKPWQSDSWKSDAWSKSDSWKEWQADRNVRGGAQFPDHFEPNRECLDANVHWGGPLYRHVQSTPWSRKHGLAGKAMVDVSCADLSYKGWDEPALRWISSGRYASPIWCKSISESVFLTGMLAAMRDNKFRLDDLASVLWKDHDEPPDKIQHAIAFMKPLILKAIDAMKTVQSCSPKSSAECREPSAPMPDEKEPPVTPIAVKRKASPALAPSKRGKSTSSTLPVVADEAEVPDSGVPDEYDPDLALHPPGQQSILTTCMPRSLTDFAFLHWVANFKAAHVPVDQHIEFDNYAKLVETLYNTQNVPIEKLRDAAKLWGLPSDLCSKAQKTALLRLVAAAAFVAI